MVHAVRIGFKREIKIDEMPKNKNKSKIRKTQLCILRIVERDLIVATLKMSRQKTVYPLHITERRILRNENFTMH